MDPSVIPVSYTHLDVYKRQVFSVFVNFSIVFRSPVVKWLLSTGSSFIVRIAVSPVSMTVVSVSRAQQLADLLYKEDRKLDQEHFLRESVIILLQTVSLLYFHDVHRSEILLSNTLFKYVFREVLFELTE